MRVRHEPGIAIIFQLIYGLVCSDGHSQHVNPFLNLQHDVGLRGTELAGSLDPLASVQQLAEGLYIRNDLDVIDDYCIATVVVHVSDRVEQGHA